MNTNIKKCNNIKQDDELRFEEAIRNIILWIGDDPNREGLIDTPKRMIKSFKEYFSGYREDPCQILKKTFTETSGYQNIVLLKNIEFSSHCEHHMAPISGIAHIAYYPNKRVVGISKIARIVEIFSKRLQIQERLTNDIAKSIQESLEPMGVAVQINAKHSCMSNRGVNQRSTQVSTYTLLGCFKCEEHKSKIFFDLVNENK